MKKGVISVIGICGESIFMKLDHFHEVGETVVTNNIHIEAGGKGINQALTLASLGAKVNYLTALGKDDYAKQCENVFKDAGLNYRIAYKDGVSTDVGIILTDKTGENQVTVYSGASARLNADDVYGFEDEIANSEFLLMQLECDLSVLKTGIELAKKHGVKVILNPAPAKKIPDELFKDIWLFTPNEQESELLFETYKANNAVITLGKKGAKIIEGDKETIVPIYPAKRVNTTGAGDVFNGALCYMLLKGENLVEAVKFANCASSIKVESSYVLDGIPSLKQVTERYNNFDDKAE